jgi:hypothetical protein
MNATQPTHADMQQILEQLRRPFHPSRITWKPGAVKGDRALALAYADLRAYMDRLDEVCGIHWSVAYEPWGEDRIICRLSILGVTRSSTGETTNEAEKSEIGGTVAEAQAMKRAAAMFGLGRYLYNLPTGWADYDPATKRFTEKAKARLMGILVQHYRRATDVKSEMADIFATDSEVGNEDSDDADADSKNGGTKVNRAALLEQFEAMGINLYGDQWETSVRARNVSRISDGKTVISTQLDDAQLEKLIVGMNKLLTNRTPTAVAA